MPTWPTTLPQIVQLSGYQESAPNLIIRTQMDVGPAKVRRRSTANIRPIAATLKLAQNQTQYLDNFYMNDCAGGALPFAWQTQRSPDDEALILDTSAITDTVFYLVSANYRFVKQPTYRPLGGGWYEASLDLEMMP